MPRESPWSYIAFVVFALELFPHCSRISSTGLLQSKVSVTQKWLKTRRTLRHEVSVVFRESTVEMEDNSRQIGEKNLLDILMIHSVDPGCTAVSFGQIQSSQSTTRLDQIEGLYTQGC